MFQAGGGLGRPGPLGLDFLRAEAGQHLVMPGLHQLDAGTRGHQARLHGAAVQMGKRLPAADGFPFLHIHAGDALRQL